MKKTFLLGTALFMQAALYAQFDVGLSAFTIPTELSEQADEVIRYDIGSYEAESAAGGSYPYKGAVTILNLVSRANRITVSYDKDTKVKAFKATLYDMAGLEVRKIDKDEIQDVSMLGRGTLYDDARAKYLEVNYNQYPYTIAFQYEVSGEGLGMISNYFRWFFQGFDQGVEKSSFTLIYPPELAFHSKCLNAELEPEVRTIDGKEHRTWTLENLRVIPSEEDMPPSASILPMLLNSPLQMNIEGYEGSMQDWAAFGQFMNQLYEGRDVLPENVRTEVQEI
ncbi:MAG: DUF3857 domain-containing protein, partial [Phaeodactylibacter sp.]|nr:DUF3857 domain-containing protein [Phaeodactylibacter sp.]